MPDHQLEDALLELFPDGLTTAEERTRHETGRFPKGLRGFQRSGRNGIDREGLANEAAWMRVERKSWAQIGDALGLSAWTARTYVAALDPSLLDLPEVARRGGRPAGTWGKLSDDQLRTLHRIYLNHRTTIAALARGLWERVGYASEASARVAITNGWRRLGLELCEQRGTCQATKRGTKRFCRRPALKGGRYCYAHSDAGRAAQRAAAMRERSPLKLGRGMARAA